MDPVTLLLATLLAAAAADHQEKRSRRGSRPELPPDLQRKKEDRTAEGFELLSEEWPEGMTPIDWALMELLESAGEPVHPWTYSQLDAFQKGRLICPLGHELKQGTFEYLEIPILKAAMRPGLGRQVQIEKDREEEDLADGLIRCTAPGHTHADRTFWAPTGRFELVYEP